MTARHDLTSVALSVSLGERPVARPHCSTFLMPLQSLKYDIKCHVKCCVPDTVKHSQAGAKGMEGSIQLYYYIDFVLRFLTSVIKDIYLHMY